MRHNYLSIKSKLLKDKKSMALNYILLIFSILLIPFSSMLILTIKKTSDLELESANEYLSNNLQTISSTIDQEFKYIEKMQLTFIVDVDFQKALKKLSLYDEREEYSDYLNCKTIKNNIVQTSLYSDYIYSIYAYSTNSQRFFSSKVNWNPKFNHFNINDLPWYLNNNGYLLEDPWTIITGIEDGRTLLSNTMILRSSMEKYPYGIISINVDSSVITNLLKRSNNNQNNSFFMTDTNSNIINDNSKKDFSFYTEISQQIPTDSSSGFFQTNLSSGKYFISYYTSDYSKFTYISACPLSEIKLMTKSVTSLLWLYIIYIVIVIIICIIIAYYYLFTPVKTLLCAMKDVEQGDFSTRLLTSNSKEIDYINTNFNNMVSNIQKLIEENYMAKLINKEAQLKAIQNQLNEHFLYNTLDSIHWMAKKENALEACDMIYSLANFYRISLSCGKDYISVRDVISMIESYLHIQKIRMGDIFNYHIQYHEDLLNEIVLKYSFQPLIENVFTHGIKDKVTQVMIEISFWRNSDYIHFKVHDNGNGMSNNNLLLLHNQLNDNYSNSDSFALKTIIKQLKNLYGDYFTYNIESIEGEFFEIELILPSDIQRVIGNNNHVFKE